MHAHCTTNCGDTNHIVNYNFSQNSLWNAKKLFWILMLVYGLNQDALARSYIQKVEANHRKDFNKNP